MNNNNLEINWSTFKGLVSLQRLYIRSNNIKSLQDGVFHIMRAIETIELDNNEISSLSRQGLFNLTMLHHLSLSNNSINRIEPDTWEFTQSLVSLDLSHNNISDFKPQHLDCLSRLKSLNLAHNKLQYLADGTFECVKNLEDLNLRRNRLSWIIEDVAASPPFKTLRKLKKLDLYGNNLKQITTKSLSGLSSLESLNLGGNALSSVQAASFDHMHLQKIQLKSYNFICDCELLYFRKWLQQQQQSHQSVLTAECGYPENLINREVLSLQQSDFNCGKYSMHNIQFTIFKIFFFFSVDSPKPHIVEEPTSKLAVKGSNVTLYCRAKSPAVLSLGVDGELKIKWRHDNQNVREHHRNAATSSHIAQHVHSSQSSTTETQIHYDAENNQTIIVGILRLYNISYESAGRYQCVVTNSFGTTYSQKFKISIGSEFAMIFM